MVMLESMQDGLLYSNLLLKMYLKSLKKRRILMLNEDIPYTPQTIATFTRHQVGTVERALKVFFEFGLVEVLDRWHLLHEQHPTFDRPVLYRGGTEKERAYAIEASKLRPSGGADICPHSSTRHLSPELEIRD